MSALFTLLIIAGGIVTAISLRAAWRSSHAAQNLNGLVPARVSGVPAQVLSLASVGQSQSRKIEVALDNYQSEAEKYRGYAVYPVLAEIAVGSRELLRRLELKGTPEQLATARSQYVNIINQITKCIDPLNFKDAIDNPQYWNDPDKRVHDVEAVLNAIPLQITENIKQVNAESDLDFQTALAALNLYSQEAQTSKLLNAKSDGNR